MVRQGWNLKSRVMVNGRIPLSFYRSKRSALGVALAESPGPMVKGIMTFATETDTDEGLPHTLEHLVFMGSTNYPFKGVLDVIANRCLASGTNALTDQDYTRYDLNTVGEEGFLKILPVYLDHLLSPTLTDSQFKTEVHHINGEGEDAGVVYSEMQDSESDMESMVNRKVKELLYPPKCSYRVSTGGRLADIRCGCSNVKVREYHSQFYHLKNLVIAVCGKVDPDKLLASIEPVEERELAKVPQHFERPFQTKVPPLKSPQHASIVCPADDESKGVVEMAWLGPSATELYNVTALLVLFDYLTETSVAPLKKDFVQTDDPYCSAVCASIIEQETCEIDVHFSGVPTEKLGEIKERFFNKTMAEHAKPGSFDMERIGFIIQQAIKRHMSKMENNPSSQIFSAVVGHQLYSPGYDSNEQADSAESREDLRVRMNEVEQLVKLQREPEKFWLELLKNTFTPNCVCVEGKPSAAAVDEFTAKEEERVEKQRERLGDDGLDKCEKSIQGAIEKNTANKPTDDVLDGLIVKDFQNFNLFHVEMKGNRAIAADSAGAAAVQKCASNSFISPIPLPTLLHQVESEFAEAVLLIDTNSIPLHLRHYMMLFFELLSNSPAMVDGKRLSYEEVSKLATRDLLSNSASVGVSGAHDQLVSVRLRVDAPNYSSLAKWAEIYLAGTVFEADRIAISAKKLAALAADSKRDGNTVSSFVSCYSTYVPESNSHFYNYISTEDFHKEVAAKVASQKAGEVIARLEELRAALLAAPVNLHLIGDETKLGPLAKNENAGWGFLAKGHDNGIALFKGVADGGQTWAAAGSGRVVPVGGSESSFLLQKAEFPQDWNGPTVMEVVLLANYVDQCEGPLWNGVRGTGLAYGANIYVIPDRKSLILSLFRCSQIGKAYEQTKKVVLDILNSDKLDDTLFEAAKRSLVCDLIGAEGTIKSAAQASILYTLRGVDPSFTLDLCSRIWHAKAEEVLAKGRSSLLELFNEQKCVRSLAVNPSKMQEVMKAFPNTKAMKLEKMQIA